MLFRSQLVPLALVVASLFATQAFAVPEAGSARPDIRLHDAWDRTLELKSLHGMPVLVVYEDKDSASQNQAFKDDLGQLARGDRYKDQIALVAVADVDGYDYWPVRGFVKSAIRDESRKWNTVIYCDWNGGVRQSLRLDRGASNVVLFGKSGRVLFSHAGPMSREQRAQVIALLRREVGERR